MQVFWAWITYFLSSSSVGRRTSVGGGAISLVFSTLFSFSSFFVFLRGGNIVDDFLWDCYSLSLLWINKKRYWFVSFVGETAGHKIGGGDLFWFRDFHGIVGLKSKLISYIKNINLNIWVKSFSNLFPFPSQYSLSPCTSACCCSWCRSTSPLNNSQCHLPCSLLASALCCPKISSAWSQFSHLSLLSSYPPVP